MKKFLLFVALVHLHLFCFVAKAQYSKLIDFNGATYGSEPHSDLISEGAFLYGMTFSGGTNSCGVIFKISPNGTGYSKLFDFSCITSGDAPYGSLISDGTFLYGMTTRNIFKIKLDGTEYFKLLDFASTDGVGAFGSLIYDGIFLYGMTSAGGANICDQYGSGCGIIFRIKTDGTDYAKLYDFENFNGGKPFGSLISDGTYLYGMTRQGGTNSSCISTKGCGVVFKIKNDGTEYTNLFDFDGVTTGGSPVGSLISNGNFLYGMTPGTIFKLKHDGTGYSKLLDFTGPNGTSANGSLNFDGTFLYGMTRAGGTSTNCGGGCGTAFKIKPDGTGYSKLIDFMGANGSDAKGSLIYDGSFLYGMTRTGGTNNMGVVFSLNVSTVTSIDKVTEKETEINVFPNPANSLIVVSIQSNNSQNVFQLNVTNALSQTVYSETIQDIPGTYTKQIDLSSLPKGIYFIVLNSVSENKNERTIKRIILQ